MYPDIHFFYTIEPWVYHKELRVVYPRFRLLGAVFHFAAGVNLIKTINSIIFGVVEI